MHDFEYEHIISKYEAEFNTELSDKTRIMLVAYHQRLEETIEHFSIPFDLFCKEIVIKEMCNKLRPGMELYERAYSLKAQN